MVSTQCKSPVCESRICEHWCTCTFPVPGTCNATLVSYRSESLLCNDSWRSPSVRHPESLSNPPHQIPRVLNRSHKHLLLPSSLCLPSFLARVSNKGLFYSHPWPLLFSVCLEPCATLPSEVTCQDRLAQHVSTCSLPVLGSRACCCR